MKLAWSPDSASKAYLDTVKTCQVSRESGVAELVAAMAAGWNAQFIAETWMQGGAIATSIGLAIARSHTGGRHVCVVPDEQSGSEYAKIVSEAGVSSLPEIVVGEAEEVMEGLVGIDFLVVDCRRKDFSRVFRLAKLSGKGGVLVCKNAYSRSASRFRWRSVVDGESSRRVVRSVFLPVGKGLDIAHVSAAGGGNYGMKRWIKHFDQRTGELHVIRK
ncbi:hypothetical protein QN277_003580 [Acacia crassicarpa]|uniref:DUF1442 family protein n=1 Tax=Acacia crassicarpa TaxID=499986 RepID=A0AAE1IYU8_9FABA|nr:hypothetical protein QN277_003580 [Acacia crassicarpa]